MILQKGIAISLEGRHFVVTQLASNITVKAIVFTDLVLFERLECFFRILERKVLYAPSKHSTEVCIHVHLW